MRTANNDHRPRLRQIPRITATDTMSTLNKAIFLATIPPIMSGIKTGGDGMRVQFDIPETEMGEGAKLIAMRGQVLKITVEVAATLTEFDDGAKKVAEDGSPRMDRRRSANR